MAATRILSGNSGGTSGGHVGYELWADQTGGDGNNRTVKLTLKLQVLGNPSYPSWFGYPAQHKFNLNGTWTGWYTTKGTESWQTSTSWREFTYTATTNVGTTSSKSITVGFQLNSYSGSDMWDMTKSGSFTVGQTNTAPYFASTDYLTFKENNSSGATITAEQSGTENAKKISEATSAIYISWPAAKDNEGGTITYEVWNQQNESTWSKLGETTSTNYTHSIGAGNEGRSYDYYVKARDTAGATSSSCNGTQFQKNAFTGDTLSSSSSINYSSSSISFSYSGAKNTNGNTTFTRTLTCDGLTVYNGSLGASPATVTIYKSGTVPTTCYVKFDDIKNKFSGSANYQGTLVFKLTTKNAYNTTKESTKSISVDIRTNPNPVTSQVISTNASESTIYKKTTSGTSYFIPDGTGFLRVNWSAGSGKLGETVKYEVYVAYGSGGWTKLAEDLPSTTTFHKHQISVQTISQSVKYLIRTITSYGYHSDAETAPQTLHYYNAPGITIGAITRGATTASVKTTVKSNTSLPSVQTVGSWLTTPTTTTGSLSTSQAEQTISLTGLTDGGTYTLKITYNDNTGFSTDQSKEVSIGKNSPIFFVNQYGVGVNGVIATADRNLNIKGSIGFYSTDGTTSYGRTVMKTYHQGANGLNLTIDSGGILIIGSGESATSLYGETLNSIVVPTAEETFITSDNSVKIVTACNTVTNGECVNKKVAHFNTSGNLHISGDFYAQSTSGIGGSSWQKVYHQGYKPTASDVGAVSKSGDTMTGVIKNSFTTGTYLNGNQGNALLSSYNATAGNYIMFNRYASTNGYFTMGGYQNKWLLQYTVKSTVDAGTNSVTKSVTLLDEDGNSSFSGVLLPAGTSDGTIMRTSTGNTAWRSMDLYRENCRVRYGIGNVGASRNVATIETWMVGDTAYRTRLEVADDRLRYMDNDTDTAFNCWANTGGHGGIAIGTSSSGYLKWLRTNTDIQFRNYADNAYTRAIGSAWVNSSKREFKTNIIPYKKDISVKSIIMDNTIYEYQYTYEVNLVDERLRKARLEGAQVLPSITVADTKLGLVLEELTPEAKQVLHPQETEGIDVYCMVSLLWKHNQELQEKVDELSKKIKERLGE